MRTISPRRPHVARKLSVAAMLALALFAGACKDDEEEEEEPSVTSAVLTFSNGQTATLTGVGVTPAVRIPVGVTTVTAQWRRADGSPDPLVNTTEYRLEVVSSGLTFARSAANAFSGTLTAATATSAAIPTTFALFHVGEGHTDFGPFTVNVAVGP